MKITKLSSKLSTYENHLDKMSINKERLQSLTLHAKEIWESLSSMKISYDKALRIWAAKQSAPNLTQQDNKMNGYSTRYLKNSNMKQLFT